MKCQPIDNSDLADLQYSANSKLEKSYLGFNQKWSQKDMLHRLREIESLMLHKPGLRRDVELLMERRRLLEDTGIISMPVP